MGELPVPGRPTYLDYSRARASCACIGGGGGGGGLDIFFSRLSFLSQLSDQVRQNQLHWYRVI